MKNIYLTARFCRQAEMKLHRDVAIANGHRVTSRWIDEDTGTPPDVAAKIDIEDLDRSDVLIAFSEFNDIGYYTGGRHVELGYAIAKGIRIIFIGPKENVFFLLPGLQQAMTIEEALELIAKDSV